MFNHVLKNLFLQLVSTLYPGSILVECKHHELGGAKKNLTLQFPDLKSFRHIAVLHWVFVEGMNWASKQGC